MTVGVPGGVMVVPGVKGTVAEIHGVLPGIRVWDRGGVTDTVTVGATKTVGGSDSVPVGAGGQAGRSAVGTVGGIGGDGCGGNAGGTSGLVTTGTLSCG